MQKAHFRSQNGAPDRAAGGILVLVILVVLGIGTILFDRPPRPMDGSRPQGQFSAERALKHISAISRSPHPVGSAAHADVRDYILGALAQTGLKAEIQRTTSVSQKTGVAASVENIVARLQGSGTEKSVLLVAHYDSMPTSFGASDDGAGVATLLETARALKALPQPKKDVVFLFTDGEEIGLLGAEAFVAGNPLAANVGVALNFEARGTDGPAILFETSSQNGSLIRAVSQVAHHPVANSLSYEIYKRLPNDTDFTVFKRAGYSGLNFAFIEGLVHYHTAEDDYANLNPGSLQQEGDYAVDLANWFDNAAQNDLKEGNAVYFDVLGMALVRYSSTVALLLVVLAAALLVGTLVQGHRKALLNSKGIFLGVLIVALAVVAAFAGSFIAGWLLDTLAGMSRRIQAGELYDSGLYVAALSTLGLATASTVFGWGSRRIGSRNLAVAGSLVWFALLLLTSVFVPGAGYLWLWPLLFVLAAWNFIFSRNIQRGSVLLTVAAIPAVVVMAPTIHKVYMAFAMGSHPMVSILLALLVALLAEQLAASKMPRPWTLPAGLYAIGFGLIIAALFFAPHFDKTHPGFDSVFYAEDADTGKTLWASYDNQPDEWTSQFFSNPIQKETLNQFFPGNPKKFLQAPAPAAPLSAPQIEVIENKVVADGRQIHVRVISPRHAPILSFFASGDAVTKASVNGKNLPNSPAAQGPWVMQYFAVPAEGIELTLNLKSASPVRFQVADISFGLPQGASSAFKARPENVIPLPARLSNTTVVSKSFSL
jgi:hypothetical protein